MLKDSAEKVFDTLLIEKGFLVYAKHKTWPEGKAGFVTSITEQEIIVQYHPGRGNVTNHFFLPSKEVAAGEWEIRWSKDLSQLSCYPEKEEIVYDS